MNKIHLGFHTLLAALFLLGCSPNPKNQETESPAGFTLKESDLPEYEKDIDHKGLLTALGDRTDESIRTGEHIYNNVCFNCHGNPETPGSIPNAFKFWEDEFKVGKDPYSLYQTLTRGYGSVLRLLPHHAVQVFLQRTDTTDRDHGRFAYNAC